MSSVEAVQLRFVPVDVVPEAARPTGVVGGEVSPPSMAVVNLTGCESPDRSPAPSRARTYTW
ncbi:hypothetical protein ACIBF6_07280 [Streptosporangium amethystogenes]|uniref:hypothetical protein n=1 Tax=Streptosporangium amethystogenes TaxID=2002 RepID=UPI0037A102BB